MIKKTACIILWLACAYIAGAQSHNASSDDSKIEINNERVIVRRNIHPAHAVTPMHSHKAGVVVFLTDVREASTQSDGTSKIVSHKAGDVTWADAREHSLRNLSDQASEVIEIELK